jgi:hypothetical protein
MAEIIKVYKEHLPALRFIGKRYTDNDRVHGGYGHKWGEWFQNDWFSPLEKSGSAGNIENGYLGFMRCYPNFEYWIGVFLPPKTTVPDGYDFIDIDEGDVGVCWIKGNHDDGSIYSMHEKCIESLKENGMSNFRKAEDGRAYFFERYNCPRFTEKDENGNVILDYGIYLTD